MKLETKRLILREWDKKDIKDIVKNLNNLEVSKWLLVVPHPYTLKDAKWWINNCKKKAENKQRENYQFAIELKSEKKIIGGVGLTHVDLFQETAEIGYWLGEEYWRKKYGSEVLEDMLKFAFNKLKLRRLNAGVFDGNPSSGKLLEKFGFKNEGLSRKACRSKANKKIYDGLVYGLLKEDWKK